MLFSLVHEHVCWWRTCWCCADKVARFLTPPAFPHVANFLCSHDAIVYPSTAFDVPMLCRQGCTLPHPTSIFPRSKLLVFAWLSSSIHQTRLTCPCCAGKVARFLIPPAFSCVANSCVMHGVIVHPSNTFEVPMLCRQARTLSHPPRIPRRKEWTLCWGKPSGIPQSSYLPAYSWIGISCANVNSFAVQHHVQPVTRILHAQVEVMKVLM